jgi:hypothetical protein
MRTGDRPFGIHCKAGMGRTGTLIAFHLMEKYRLTGREAIAWMRMCRNGMIDANQQQFILESDENAASGSKGRALTGSKAQGLSSLREESPQGKAYLRKYCFL